MTLYTQCYVMGEGYVLKSMDGERGALGELPINRLTPQIRAAFTRTGAKLLLASLDGMRFGCVRRIDTAERDENGRVCQINLGFACDKREASEVDGLIVYAARRYPEFARAARHIIARKGQDYDVNADELRALVRESLPYAALLRSDKPIAMLAPETDAAYFLKSTRLPFLEKDIGELISTQLLKEA